MNQKETSEPQYIELLDEKDKELYTSLRANLTSPNCRNCRNKRLEGFDQMLKSIKDYAIRNDANDSNRCLVCGVCWLSDGIAINTHQLTLLLGKCKSSINGSLHRLKYVPFPSSQQASTELMEFIPRLKGNFSELRQWTLRKQVVYTPQPKFEDTNSHMMANIEHAFANTPEPKFEGFFDTFEDDQNVQKERENFFCDPYSIPLNDWQDNDWDENNNLDEL